MELVRYENYDDEVSHEASQDDSSDKWTKYASCKLKLFFFLELCGFAKLAFSYFVSVRRSDRTFKNVIRRSYRTSDIAVSRTICLY